MYVFCPHCGQQVDADDLNIDTAIARCRPCNAVFSFAEALQHESTERQPPPRREPVAPPPNIREEAWGDTRRFTWRWFRASYLGLLMFCVAWDSFLVFWYTIAFTQKAPWIMVVFPLLHVAVGVGLTYTTVCGLFNRTTVEVTSSRITVRHAPLPWPGNHTLAADDIDQLYCHRALWQRQNQQGRFELVALLRNHRRVKLISGLDEPEYALYLEQQIEAMLGITPRSVRGEFGG